MEPSQKRAKITGHFRVALKPQDVNVPSFKKLKKAHDLGKDNRIEVITIDDEDDDENKRSLNDLKTARQQLATNAANINFSSITSNNNNHNCYKNRNNNIQNNVNRIERYLRRANVKEEKEQLQEEDDVELEELDDEKDEKAKEEDVVILNDDNNHSKSGRHLTRINRYHKPPGLKSTDNCDNIDSIVDYDECYLDDIHYEPHYAWDSFNYDRQRELLFQNKNYLDNQDISTTMRARLVDWLVFIQNNFSLDHEALYMAVKMSDQYLMKKQCPRYLLPLLYLTSVLISSKFEERLPAVSIAELMEHSNRKYSRKMVLQFEADLLKVLNFNIRFPLSYTFLRRFALCTNSDKTILTLARYILESSLLEYDMIDIIESKLAAASLLLAFKMLDSRNNKWDKTAIYYTGYKEEELYTTLISLNYNICSEKVSKSTTRKKYNHQIFLNVAKIPPLSIEHIEELAGHDAKKITITTTNH